MKMKRYKYRDLTPIYNWEHVYLKRDDLYKPFDDFEITGGKVRQCLYLVESNLKQINSNYGGTIATAASVLSPQAVIVARVAKEFGLKCILGVGTDTPLKHRAMQMASDLGAELVTLCTSNAYNNVLYSKLAELNLKRKFFTIQFGYQASVYRDAIIEMNALQVQNIPAEVESLVIPVGSGVSAAGILAGVQRYRRDLLESRQVYLLQPFGYDRRDTIYSCADLDFGLQPVYDGGNYTYAKALDVMVGGVKLDEIYEAKSYDMMKKKYWRKLPKPVCFWIVGDSNILRHKYPNQK